MTSRHFAWLLVYVVAVLVYAVIYSRSPNLYLDVVQHAATPSVAELSYVATDQTPARTGLSAETYRAGESHLLLPMTAESVSSLRLSPTGGTEPVKIERLRIVNRVGTVLARIPLTSVRAADQSTEVRIAEGMLLVSPATTPDSSSAVNLPVGHVAAGNSAASPWAEIALFTPLLFLAALLLRRTGGVEWPRFHGPIATLIAAGVVLLMVYTALSMTTSHSINPDETMHVAAARYYLSNWLPPGIGDPRVAGDPEAYAGWGFSYLDEWDICYFFAGKTAVLLSPFVPDELLRLRLFNLLLFALLLGIGFSRRWALPMLAILLINPQVWYVFTYFNADAFALAAACLAVLYATEMPAEPEQPIWKGQVTRLLVCASLISLVILSKRNFWTVLPFIALIWLVRLRLAGWFEVVAGSVCLLSFSMLSLESQYSFSGADLPLLREIVVVSALLPIPFMARRFFSPQWNPPQRKVFLGIAVVVAATACISLPRIAWDLKVNGSPATKAEKLVANENLYAAPDRKPANMAKNQGLPSQRLKDRGIAFGALLSAPWNWPTISFFSFFGAYGYVRFVTPAAFTNLLFLSAFLLSVVSLWQLRREESSSAVLAAVAMAGVVMANSLLAAWIIGFQAQGRYLFAVLPMLLLRLNDRLSQPAARMVRALVVFSACVGAWCFYQFGTKNLLAL